MAIVGVGGAVAAILVGLAVSYIWGLDFTLTIVGSLLAWGGVFLLIRGISLGSATAILFAIALGPLSLLTFWMALKERD